MAQEYEKKELRQHIFDTPDTYVGGIEFIIGVYARGIQFVCTLRVTATLFIFRVCVGGGGQASATSVMRRPYLRLTDLFSLFDSF